MKKIDIFGDDRKIPKLSVNVKVRVKTESLEDSIAWNQVFGYIMKKPRTKLEFLSVNPIRNLSLNNITVESIKEYLTKEDHRQLLRIENLFNNRLTADLKAFILALLRVPYASIKELSDMKSD